MGVLELGVLLKNVLFSALLYMHMLILIDIFVRSGGVEVCKQGLWCGQSVRSGGVNALSHKQGPWVWSVSEKWWG